MSEVRLIDANALLEKMRSYDIQGETFSIARNWAMYQVMDAPTIESKQEWIPVSERLPEAECGESDSVLATCKHKDEDEPRWIRLLYFNGGNWCYPTGEVYTSEVIAWMPLPEPYERSER